MNKTIKLTIAALIAALATTIGVAAPADAKTAVIVSRDHVCC
jgi:putative cell wall-binding protein